MTTIIRGINDLATLRADLAELKREPELFAAEIREAEAEIARQEAASMPAPDCEPKKVEEIKLGEFVKRKADATKVYRRGGFDRSTKRFALVDCEDMNREIWVKRGTILFVGFTY